MLEILQHFESTVGEVARARPLLVVGLGIAAVAVGLCVWLGGLSLRKLLVAVSGAATGAVIGLVLLGGGVVPVAGSAVVAAVIARVFEEVFVTVMAAALAGLVSFVVLAGPWLSPGPADGALSGRAGPPGRDEPDVHEFKAYVMDVAGKIGQAARLMPPQRWAIAVLSAAIFLVGGLTIWRPTAALCFSVIGTMLIFGGMILLLVHKGAMPVALISSRPATYAGAFAAMAIFGTIEQFLLCRVAPKKVAKPEQPKRKSRTD